MPGNQTELNTTPAENPEPNGSFEDTLQPRYQQRAQNAPEWTAAPAAPVAPTITDETIRGIVGGELIGVKQQISRLDEAVAKLTSVCKESLDYGQRYQKNTVTVLQSEVKDKDRLINGIILVDLLKPIAAIAAKIEKRISKTEAPADRKFLQDLLDEITETAEDEYGVAIARTSSGKPRPENISQVAEVVPTGDEPLKNLVAESLNSSWVINGRLIQKEKVKVYKFDPVLAPSPEIAVELEETPLEQPDEAESAVAPEPQAEMHPPAEVAPEEEIPAEEAPVAQPEESALSQASAASDGNTEADVHDIPSQPAAPEDISSSAPPIIVSDEAETMQPLEPLPSPVRDDA